MNEGEMNEGEMNDDEKIRKIVGREQEKRPLKRAWELRQQLLSLGVDLENDDEYVRKVVGRPKPRRR